MNFLSQSKPKSMNILILNGPNLNLLGKREPDIYGHQNFEDYFSSLQKKLHQLNPNIHLHYYQSNLEGELINKLHELGFSYEGIIFNPGGYTHSSIALADAVAAITAPVIEVHISNTYARESFRHISYIAKYANGRIVGFGLLGYWLGILGILETLSPPFQPLAP